MYPQLLLMRTSRKHMAVLYSSVNRRGNDGGAPLPYMYLFRPTFCRPGHAELAGVLSTRSGSKRGSGAKYGDSIVLHRLMWIRRSRLIAVNVFNPLKISTPLASETGRSTRQSQVDDKTCGCTRKHLGLPIRGLHVYKISGSSSSKARPLMKGMWRLSVGSKKPPHEGHNDKGLIRRLLLPHNKPTHTCFL